MKFFGNRLTSEDFTCSAINVLEKKQLSEVASIVETLDDVRDRSFCEEFHLDRLIAQDMFDHVFTPRVRGLYATPRVSSTSTSRASLLFRARLSCVVRFPLSRLQVRGAAYW